MTRHEASSCCVSFIASVDPACEVLSVDSALIGQGAIPPWNSRIDLVHAIVQQWSYAIELTRYRARIQNLQRNAQGKQPIYGQKSRAVLDQDSKVL